MITVVGSFVVDLTARTPHMPVPGETVLGRSFKLGPGGKGCNQATAAARAGSRVSLITKLGDDEFGKIAVRSLTADGINLDYTPITKDETTGTALILVDDSGENMIVVTLGACGTITRNEVFAAEETIRKSSVVVLQLETSNEANIAAVELAHKYGVPVIFNPAPYNGNYPKEILPMITYATPNETEAGYMAGVEVVDDDSTLAAAAGIKKLGVQTVIITLGKRGCLVYIDKSSYSFVPAFKVEAIDTTGAGDAFNGGLAHAIDTGMGIQEAVRFASAVAAISVTRFGTAPAMPTDKEIKTFIRAEGV
ncbi:MAG: ribokinase [Treponema sp.]|jgi:ribokinase|nr:ribokinase [Treponema sp.]